MSIPDFGEIIEEGAAGYVPEFGEEVEPVSRIRSLFNAPVKGALKGARSQSKISPFHQVGAIKDSQAEELMERFLPTKESPIEGALEKSAEIGTSFLTGGPGGLIRKGLTSLLGGAASETTKQLGGGEIAQDIAALSSMSLPDLAKSIPAKKAQERVISFLRKKGFTENEITPLIQSPQKLSSMASFASKGEKTNQLMRDIYGKMGTVYEGIRNEATNLPGLSREAADEFTTKFSTQLDKIPKFYKRQIKEEIEDLMNSEMKFSDFIDFDQAVNARIKGVSGGKAILGTLKKATGDAKQAISPELANDLTLANEIYGKGIDVSGHLRTKEIEELFDLGEKIALVSSIADQNVGLLTKVLGIGGARKIATELLINPRLQNINKRMLRSIKKNRLPEAIKLFEIFRREAIQSNPDLEEIFEKAD